MIESNRIAPKLLAKNTSEFWNELKRLNASKKVISNNINGITNDNEITKLWKDHYCKIFNSVPISNFDYSTLIDEIERRNTNILHVLQYLFEQ